MRWRKIRATSLRLRKTGGRPPGWPGPRGIRNIPVGRKSRIAREAVLAPGDAASGRICSGSSCRRARQARRSHSRRVRRGPRVHGRALRRKMPGCSHAPMVSNHSYRFPCGRLHRTNGRLPGKCLGHQDGASPFRRSQAAGRRRRQPCPAEVAESHRFFGDEIGRQCANDRACPDIAS